MPFLALVMMEAFTVMTGIISINPKLITSVDILLEARISISTVQHVHNSVKVEVLLLAYQEF